MIDLKPPAIANDEADNFRSNVIFRKLIENTFAGVTLLDGSLRVIYLNPAAAAICGWSFADKQMYTMDDLIHPEDLDEVRPVIDKIFNTPETPFTCSFRSRHYIGHYVYVECTFSNLLHIDGINAIVCNFNDVTKEKEAEVKLQRTVQELTAYKQALDESAIIAITDQKGVIKHVNNYFCRLSQYTREELVGQDHRIINSKHHDPKFFKELWATIAKGRIWRGEIRNRSKHGQYYWVDTTIVPFLDSTGKPYQYVSIRFDITETKQAEIERRKYAEQISHLLENISDGFVALDADMRYTYANKQISKMLGTEIVDLIGKNIWDIFPDVVGTSTHKAILTALQEQCPVINEDYYAPLNLWQENRIYPTGDGLSMFVRDISRQKQEEQHLRLLESVITNATDAVMITEADALTAGGPKVLYVNRAFTDMTGYAADEIIGNTPALLQGAGSDAAELERIRHAMASRQPCKVVLKNYKKDGREFWVDMAVSPVFDQVGKCTHFIAIERDVSRDVDEKLEKQKLTNAIQESLNERNTILESIGDGFFAVDRNWTITYWNRVAASILHKRKEEALEKTFWELFPDFVGSLSYRKYRQAFRTKKAVHFEQFYKPLKRWYDISAYPSGAGLSIYFRDATDRKKAEEILITSERKYSELFDLSPLPTWVFDVDTLKFLDVNAAALSHYGYTKQEFLSMGIEDIRLPADVPALHETLKESRLKTHFLRVGTFKHKKKNGEVITVRIMSNTLNYRGHNAKVVVANDITERMKYISAIEEQNERMKEISWIQSHLVRAPLSRIMGLIPLITEEQGEGQRKMLEYLKASANDLDNVIKDITEKTAKGSYDV